MSRIDALHAMANQDVSPHERDIARAKLAEMGAGDRLPPRRPPAVPAPGGSWDRSFVYLTNASNVTITNVRIWTSRQPWSYSGE